MPELPSDRLQESPPFQYCGVDLFGPFTIQKYKKELKRYGVMFTCLCIRAIHIKVAQSLETDSFILLIRFIGRRGNMCLMRSYNGTNFVVLRSYEKPSKRWTIIKYHSIYKDTKPIGQHGSESHPHQPTWVECGNDRLEQQEAS